VTHWNRTGRPESSRGNSERDGGAESGSREARHVGETGRPTAPSCAPPRTSGVIDSLVSREDDAPWRVAVKRDPTAPSKRFLTGDVWADARLLQAAERMAKAHASTAQRALLRGSRPPRLRVRVWLGSFLRAVGHRLCGHDVEDGRADAPGRAARGQLADP
jgi:hypothetical protein